MTSDEIVRLLETFRAKYTPNGTIDDDTIQLWKDQFLQTDRELMKTAVLDYLANEEFFPKPARLREYISKHSRQVRRAQPRGGCVDNCDSGWVESQESVTAVASRPTLDPHTKRLDGPPEAYELTYPPGVYPCRACRPDAFNQWHDAWVPEAIRNRPAITPDTLLPANPQKGIALARRTLAAAGNVTKDASTL